MTPQKLYQFVLSEIPFLDFNCKTCKSAIRLTFPIKTLSSNLQCAGCGTPFWYAGNSIYPLMQQLTHTFGAYIEKEADLAFSVSFSLVSPASSNHDA